MRRTTPSKPSSLLQIGQTEGLISAGLRATRSAHSRDLVKRHVDGHKPAHKRLPATSDYGKDATTFHLLL